MKTKKERIKQIVNENTLYDLNDVFFFKLTAPNSIKIVPVVFNYYLTQYDDILSNTKFISKTKIDISVPQKTPKRTALALALISVDDQLKDFYAKKDANFVDANTTCYKSVNDLCNDVLVVYKSHLAATMHDFNTAEEDTFRFRRLSAYVDQFRVKKTFPESMNGTKFLTKKDICEFCKRTGKLLTKYENRDENYLMRTI